MKFKRLSSFKCVLCGCITSCPSVLPKDDRCPWCRKNGLVRQVMLLNGTIELFNPEVHNEEELEVH